MLEGKGGSNPLRRQPTNRLPDQVTGCTGKVLAHPNEERPGGKTVAPNVAGEVNEIGVKGGYRICPYILVKKYCWAEEKSLQYQSTGQEKAEPSEQELE